MAWYWKSGLHLPDTDPAAWTPYSHRDSVRIEKAYQDKAATVAVSDGYEVHLAHLVQAKVGDSDKQRPVKRETESAKTDTAVATTKSPSRADKAIVSETPAPATVATPAVAASSSADDPPAKRPRHDGKGDDVAGCSDDEPLQLVIACQKARRGPAPTATELEFFWAGSRLRFAPTTRKKARLTAATELATDSFRPGEWSSICAICRRSADDAYTFTIASHEWYLGFVETGAVPTCTTDAAAAAAVADGSGPASLPYLRCLRSPCSIEYYPTGDDTAPATTIPLPQPTTNTVITLKVSATHLTLGLMGSLQNFPLTAGRLAESACLAFWLVSKDSRVALF